jgi:hypothetical protein
MLSGDPATFAWEVVRLLKAICSVHSDWLRIRGVLIALSAALK